MIYRHQVNQTIDKKGRVTFEFLDPTKKKFKVLKLLENI